MDHVFIMIGATSMRIEKAVITAIDILRTDDKGNQIIAMHHECKGLENFNDVIDSIETILDGDFVVISYFGFQFYKPLLENYCDVAGFKSKLIKQPWISLEQIAWPLYFDGNLKDRSIEQLGKYLGIIANDKLWLLHQCYWTLMRRLTTGIFLETKAREKGGRFFETAQQFIRRF